MMRRTRVRGVTLLEGLIACVVFLTGMVGVLQGMLVASQQNSMAARHTRGAVIAGELLTAVTQQGRARLLATGGLFANPQCGALPSPLTAAAGDLSPTPPSLTAQGFTAAGTCFVDFDALSAFQNLTPGYDAQDRTTFDRVIAVYRHPTDPEVLYVGVAVAWRDLGRTRRVERFTAIYDTATNQTTLEF